MENYTAESRKIKMLLHDDVVYQILQLLPAISLLRFKLVCKTWRALIESNDFIKQHLHRHHYDPNLKDKNYRLIHLVPGKDWPFTFPLISIDSFEKPNACVQLDFSDLSNYFPLDVLHTVSYKGIVCLNLVNHKGKHSICLWNPATKQSRVIPESPALTLEKEYGNLRTIVGVGFDVKNNDYKVVNLCRNRHNDDERVEVYSLNTDSWRSVTAVFPFTNWLSNPRMPFNNGTCFFWNVLYVTCEMIPCFDFSSEKFRCIPIPNASHGNNHYAIVVSDKIAYVSHIFDRQTIIWVLNEYGSVNEFWVELYTIDLSPTVARGTSVEWLSMDGNYLFFRAIGCIGRSDDVINRRDDEITLMACGYNVVTKEMKNFYIFDKCGKIYGQHWYLCRSTGLRIDFSMNGNLVVFKESLLSVGKGNNECITNSARNIFYQKEFGFCFI